MSLGPVPQSRRLTMVITELDVGGAEKAFVRVAIGLKNLGWDVQVVSLRDAGPLATLLEAANIEVSPLQVGGLLDIRAVWRLRRELLRRPTDVLLTFLHQANLVGRIAGRLAGVGSRRIVCGIRVADRRLIVRLPERVTKSLVDRYVAVSQSVGDLHWNLCQIASDRMVTIPNGVDLEAIDAAVPATPGEMGCGPDDKIILCVGRLSGKAPLDALEAFHLMLSGVFPNLNSGPDCYLSAKANCDQSCSGESMSLDCITRYNFPAVP